MRTAADLSRSMRPGNLDRKSRVFRLLQTAAENGKLPATAELLAQFNCRPSRRSPLLALAADRFSLVPLLGAIPAGLGDATEPVNLGSVPVDLNALRIRPTAKTFALRVRGDSMINAQIRDGDIVIIEVREARAGDIVAAVIDGETTLKRLVAQDGEFYLHAENPLYPDLLPLHGLSVQGVMRAVVRVCEPKTAPVERGPF